VLWNRNQRNRNFFTSGTGTVTYKKSEPELTGTRYKIIAADPDCLTTFFLACARYEGHYHFSDPLEPRSMLTAYSLLGQARELVQRVPWQEGQRSDLPRPHRQECAACERQLYNGRHERG